MKTSSIIFSLILCFFFVQNYSLAQGLYQENRNKGIQLFNNQKYDDALVRFKLARTAPDKPEQNDIDLWINKCKRKKQEIADAEAARQEAQRQQREAEQRRREAERREREATNQQKGYVEVSSIQIANGSGNGEPMINSYGSAIFASDVKYLYFRASINSLVSSEKNITYHIKVINPDGSLKSGSSSPSGYSYDCSVSLKPNTNTIYLSGWGNSSGGTYVSGTYRFEIWYNEKNIYSTEFTLLKKDNEATYLTVDSKTSVTSNFDWKGGSETFYVATDANQWTTWGVPSWCKIENQTSSSFTLTCEPNRSNEGKSDYMKIKAGDKEVRIDIKQKEKPGPYATINNVWVDHNEFLGLSKGMRVHISLDVANMKNQQVKYCIFFYLNDNRTKLLTLWGSHVSSSAVTTIIYDNSTFSDWSIFVPYTNITSATNAHGYYSFDVEIQDAYGNCIGRRENTQFYVY